jgi:hypothetical protein
MEKAKREEDRNPESLLIGGDEKTFAVTRHQKGPHAQGARTKMKPLA